MCCCFYSTIVVIQIRLRDVQLSDHCRDDVISVSRDSLPLRNNSKRTVLLRFPLTKQRNPHCLFALVENWNRNNSGFHLDAFGIPNNHFSTHQKTVILTQYYVTASEIDANKQPVRITENFQSGVDFCQIFLFAAHLS